MSFSLVRLPCTMVAAALSVGLLAFAPPIAGAQQGQNPGAISEAPPSSPPTLATLNRFSGRWACASAPGNGTYDAVATMSPQGNTFTIDSPKWRSVFSSSAGVLQLRRSDAAGEMTPYQLEGYVPHTIDITFASALPSERPGTTPENAFAHTFEIKRDRSGFVITKKSPRYSTIVETCKPG